ncbi:MAG: hypothetical protein GF331_18150, partial [Chitinivibrionales bacterium]|nr:hypothetical protein [Chitinivibrionales bacterium]
MQSTTRALVLFVFALCCAAPAQQISGTVYGRKGRPLQGASVFFASTPGAATLSAADGSFTISYPSTSVKTTGHHRPTPLSLRGSRLSFATDGTVATRFLVCTPAGRIIRRVAPILPAGHHTLELLRGCARGTYLVQASIGGNTQVLTVNHSGGVTEPKSETMARASGSLAKSSAAFRLVAAHDEYFPDTTELRTETDVTISLYRTEQNILVFGNSYSCGLVDTEKDRVDMAAELASQIGAVVNIVVIRSQGNALIWGLEKDHDIALEDAFDISIGDCHDYGIGALEADYNARIRARDALFLRNLDDYEPFFARSEELERAIGTLRRVDEWDVVTDQIGSKFANDTLNHLDGVLQFAQWLETNLPDVKRMFLETIAYRNDYLIHGIQPGVAFSIDNRMFNANTEFLNNYEHYTETMHYIDIRRAYRYRADRTGGDIIPWATAIQNLRFDTEYGYAPVPDPEFDYYSYNPGVLPNQEKSIHNGIKDVGGSYVFNHHPNLRGNHMQALVTLQKVFGQDVRQITEANWMVGDDAPHFARVAYQTVAENLQPDTTSRLVWNY